MRQRDARSRRNLALAALITAVLACPALAQSPIVIVAPQQGELIDARLPYTVRWEAPDIAGNSGFFVYYIHESLRHPVCDAPPAARECVWADPPGPGDFSGTIIVEARAADGTVLAATESGPFSVHEGFIPNPWVGSTDVGDVGVAGSAERNEDDSVIILRGSGAGIGGTADAFHFLFTQIVGGDAINLRATITSIDGPPGTKVGLMTRPGGADPGSAFELLAVTRGRGIAYERRFDADARAVSTPVVRHADLPVTLELMRRGNYTELNFLHDGVWHRGRVFQDASHLGFAITSGRRNVLATATLENARSDTDPFPAIFGLTPNPGDVFTAGMPIPITWSQREPHPVTLSYSLDNGETWTRIRECTSVMATSCTWHNPIESEAARIRADFDDTDDRTAWTATFEFAIRPGRLRPLPDGWRSRDIGAVDAPGSATFRKGRKLFAVAGSGAGVAGTADEFHFVSRRVVEKRRGAVEIVARVASTEAFSFERVQVGLMVRADGGAGAAHVSVFVPTSPIPDLLGLTFVRRPSNGAATVATPAATVADPAWIRFVIDSGDVRAYFREESNAPWRFLGRTRAALGSRYEAGLAVSAASDGTLARGTFDNVTITHLRR